MSFRLPSPSIGRAVLVAVSSTVLASGAFASHWRIPNLDAVQTAQVAPADLRSVAEFQQLFNADRGNARLVLLLSPT